MADTAQVGISCTYLNNGVITTTPLINFFPTAFSLPTPAQSFDRRVLAPTGGVTLSLVGFNSLSTLAIKNLDLANYVTVAFTYTDSVPTDHANVVQIPAQGVLLLTTPIKVAAGILLTANTATVQLDVVLIGA